MKYIIYGLLSILLIIVLMLVSLPGAGEDYDQLSWQRLQRGHIVLIVESLDQPFWQALANGAQQAALDRQVFVELIEIQSQNPQQMAAAINRAVLSNVDAIALQPLDDQAVSDSLAIAKAKSISVLTYENDTYTLEGVPNVGSNNYQIGRESAKLAVEATDGEATMAIFLNTDQMADPRYKSLKLQGFIEYLADQNNMQLSNIFALDFDPFAADQLTRKILNDNPSINTIICTDERRTPGIAQTIVDLNLVGKVKIIGFGNMAQTINYVEKGVIYGTICADGKEIGHTAVTTLYHMMIGEAYSETTDTTIYTYTRGNIDDYYLQFEQNKAE